MVTCKSVPYGKPDAGNPHVRFDEGEVASAMPRRGSLLYKILSSLLVGVCALAGHAATNITEDVCLQADADWRSAGPVSVAAGVTVDLNGHKLMVAGLTGEGRLIDSTFQTALAVPSVIITNAMFWLDASDKSTLTMDAAGNVSAWASKVGSQVATLQQTDVAPVYSELAYGRVCVDFGVAGSKKSLSYERFSNIRTVFAVMELQKSVHVALLTDRSTYDFYRGPNGEYLHSKFSNSNASHVWNGTLEVNRTTDVIPDGDFQVLCYEMAKEVHSDTLAMDRPDAGSGQAAYNGGKQISELILFDSVLSEPDRLAVTKYLQAKWFKAGLGEVHLDLTGDSAAVYDGRVLTIDESVTVVVDDAQLSVPCDLSGFGPVRVDGTVEMNGHELHVDGLTGTGSVNSAMPAFDTVEPLAVPTVISNAMFWLDASDKSTLTIDGEGNVSAWRSKVGSQVASLQQQDVSPVYAESGFIQPCVDFGASGSKKNLSFDGFTNIRTVFAVMKIQKSQYAQLVTDRNAYHFYRGYNGEYLNSIHSANNAAHIWNGTTLVGQPTSSVIPDGDFQLLCYEMAIDAHSDTLAWDRTYPLYTGGKQISELIYFNTVLSDADRLAVMAYLRQKWINYREAVTPLYVKVPSGQFVIDSVALHGHIQLVKEGEGTLTVSAPNQTYIGGVLVNAGKLRIGDHGTSGVLGVAGAALTVQSSSVLDINGKYDFKDNPLILNGGCAVNSVNMGDSYATFSKVVLADDSEIRSLNMLSAGWQEVSLDLQGHTLKVTGEGFPYYLCNVSATAGRIVVDDGTRLVFSRAASRAAETRFELNGPMTVNVASSVGDLVLNCPDAGYLGTGLVTVHGTFAPNVGTYPNVQLLDQSTIDLSSLTTTLACTSIEASTTFTCSFAENAAIKVEPWSRHLKNGDLLISWDEAPTGVTFAATKKLSGELVTTNKGLVYYSGLIIIVR